MPFAAGLRQSLYVRDCQVASEFTRGDSLEDVLDRHLLAVEAMAETDLVTSILLLSEDGKRLSHGAAPNLPRPYRKAIDGSEIGPAAGSCGTAAFFGRPVYVADIATDPLWTAYAHLALPHDLRSCWSTPIRGDGGEVIGTFAIYHRTVGSPTDEELAAIEMITGHVAQAIMFAREEAIDLGRQERGPPRLMLVADHPLTDEPAGSSPGLWRKLARLEILTAELERQARDAGSQQFRTEVQDLAEDGRKLAQLIRQHLELLRRSRR